MCRCEGSPFNDRMAGKPTYPLGRRAADAKRHDDGRRVHPRGVEDILKHLCVARRAAFDNAQGLSLNDGGLVKMKQANVGTCWRQAGRVGVEGWYVEQNNAGFFLKAQLPATHLALASIDLDAVLSHKQQVLDSALKDHLAHADRRQILAWRRPGKKEG